MGELKDIFGKPREGAHSYRVLDIAVVDFVGTILIAYVIAYIWKLDFMKTFITLFIVGEVMHLMVGVDTTVAVAIKKVFE